MASGKLGTAKLSTTAASTVYTVPATKTASTNITIRNQGNTSSLVSLGVTSNTYATDYSSLNITPTSSDNWYETWIGGHFGYGQLPLSGDNDVTIKVNSSYGYPQYYSSTKGLTAFTLTSPGGDALNSYAMTKGSHHNNMNSYYQISGFYNDNDYWFGANNRYIHSLKQHPLSKSTWTSSDLEGSYVDSSRSYYNVGGVGFRNVFLSANTSGYITKTIGRSGTFVNEDRTSQGDNGFYYIAGGNYGYNMPQSWGLSVLPTTRLGQGTTRIFFVYAGYSGETIAMGAHEYSRLTTSGNWGDSGGSAIYWTSGLPNSSTANVRWFRPCGDYVYAFTTGNRVYRKPITAWYRNGDSWTDVTSSFTTTMSEYPIIEDRNGVGYWFDNTGILYISDTTGGTWRQANQTSLANLSYLTNGLPSAGTNFNYWPAGLQSDTRSIAVAVSGVNGYKRNSSTFELMSLNEPGNILEKNTTLVAGALVSNTGIILGAGEKVVASTTSTGPVIQVFGYEE